MVVSLVIWFWTMVVLFSVAAVVQVAAMRNERLKMQRVQWKTEMEARRVQRFKDLQARVSRGRPL
jgi:hypothetical protein